MSVENLFMYTSSIFNVLSQLFIDLDNCISVYFLDYLSITVVEK